MQAADAAAYPPIIHAASLMAEAGWLVCVLSAPIAGIGSRIPPPPWDRAPPDRDPAVACHDEGGLCRL